VRLGLAEQPSPAFVLLFEAAWLQAARFRGDAAEVVNCSFSAFIRCFGLHANSIILNPAAILKISSDLHRFK